MQLTCNWSTELCSHCRKSSDDCLYELHDFPLKGDVLMPVCILCLQDLSRAITSVVWSIEVAR
jgi:hypothetical protein